MKRMMCCAIMIVMLFSLTACSSPKSADPNDTSAVGAVFVNASEGLQDAAKIYARFEDNSYSFDLDAASVYFLSADKDTAYAGNPNFTHMTFGANIDDNTVGAEGTISYRLEDTSKNVVTAYYLYYDGQSVWFDTATPFASVNITDMCVLKGTDYPCSVTFEVAEPVERFTITYQNADHELISQTEYLPEEVEDYQRFDMREEIRFVEIVEYNANGIEQKRYMITPENPSTVICYDNGGQILSSKALRFIWQ